MAWIYLILSVFISTAVAQTEPGEPFGSPITLPPELQAKINETDVEKYKTEYLEQFKKKCEQNGHPELFEQAQSAATDLMSCFNSLVDMEVLQQEIENAKPTGEVDEVFKKYCAKTPQFKNCFRNMTEMVKPCFSAAEQKNFNVMYNVTEQLADFVCFKEGDRIALFIAEGGKECFQDQQDGIQECLSTVFDNKTQANIQNISMSGIMELEFKEKQCDQMTSLQKCVVSTLEKCPKPTSANILDSLFNFIRKATPCKQFMKAPEKAPARGRNTEEKKDAPGAASGLAVTFTTLVTALAVSLLV
ncbi:27 kDa hemolymph protein isoform X1 [Spodoptera frugiperda]|uniref:27 kDa hemolymph protein isoform X1 n=1 Tax=Spodoptera frugiperda TaxID=7108 RepID=A0A9R0ESY5_SPOFR|nr:27 kDa hemolymph protein isoform X1 [Spodoptera frugiperda]